ncbi:sulfate ABC transporter substrate-binding protein [Neisseria zoodegmatis]|uniref:Sulfate ABC transporter substrate-binding protein n=1 Tax=Neisseria zoodegmatis TaxID=326523 RepID=A0AB38DQA2_9NEIS|nr:sulfate ABC transporter substrate-binding protein [Neisseria zoodegmatis]OSI10597.1 sulfate ABC transporter substrate-binding protein [Neisseria zoodegmatis]SNU79560.1 sulfate-binding protein [Neisseria zoodegmatis]
MIAQRPLSFAALFGAVLALSACSPKAEEQSTQVAASSDGSAAASSGSIKLLNVSYDVARDFYKEYNPLFIKAYQAKNPGAEISIQQSHGGSSKQALAVANGLQADVATMNQTSDIELLEKKGLVKAEWRTRLPDNAVPFTGTTVFLVRKGNPKQIRDWADLAKDNLQIVLANPKTSGNGRYAFLGAFGYALKTNNGDEAKAKEFTGKLLKNTPVLENGGRAATTTFTQRNIGDVLVTFENEANHVSRNLAPGQFEIVYPSYTILSESPVAVVDSVAGKKGSQAAAEEYLKYLWSEPAQELAAKFYMRPSNPAVLAKHKSEFPEMETFSPNQVFGSWEEIMKKYFADGGLFDQLAQKQ